MDIPVGLYALIGFLIISNIGALGALIIFIFKCGKFVSATETGIKDAKDCAVRAHNRIDRFEDKLDQALN